MTRVVHFNRDQYGIDGAPLLTAFEHRDLHPAWQYWRVGT